MTYFLITISTFALVFLRARQQLHVVHGQYLAAALTPYLLACAEVASVLFVVKMGWPAIPFVGTGGALGVTLAMWTHRKWKK